MEEEEGVTEQQFYSFRWRSHLRNAISSLQQYLEQSLLTDVTLACDGETFKVHQVVLSACSPYFETMFVGHPCPHPIVFMMNVKASEIRAILEFLYSGSVTVSQSCLPDFLKVAETLQIRGLMSEESEYDDTDKMEHQNESESISECQSEDIIETIVETVDETIEETIEKENLTDNQDDESVKSNNEEETTEKENLTDNPNNDDSIKSNEDTEKSKTTTTIMKKKNEKAGGYTYTETIVSNGTHVFDEIGYNNGSSTSSAVVNKVQRKLLSRQRKPRKKNYKNNKKALISNKPRLPCSICFRTFKNKNVLYNHRSVYHRQGRV